MPKFRPLLTIVCILGLLLGTIVVACLPSRTLPTPELKLTAERTGLAPQDRRHVEHIVLHDEKLGDIGLALSLPDPLPAQKLPILIVLGGLGAGEDNIRYITNAGNNAVIGYDWPMPVRFFHGASFLIQIPELYQRLMVIPAQIASSLHWLTLQPWADRERVSLLGFSLGALAAPAAQHEAEQQGDKVGWTILAYGGAPLGALFAANPHMQPRWMRDLLAPLVGLLLKPLDPTQHLPYLSGHFLILEGSNDSLMPAEARDRLREAVPEPKTIIDFPGNHMGVGPDKWVLLQKIIAASRAWLTDQGAVNLPSVPPS